MGLKEFKPSQNKFRTIRRHQNKNVNQGLICFKMHLMVVAMLCGCGSFICWLIGAIYFVLQKEVPPYTGLPEAAYMEAPRGQLSPCFISTSVCF